MRKYMFVMFSMFIFLLSSLEVNASVTLNTSESSNGVIKTNLSFKQGFVGGIDVSFKVNGDVDVSNVVWDNGLSNNYTKRYFYDSNSKTLRIIIATGDLTRNLLDRDGNMTIGEIKFSNNSTVNKNYSMDITSTTIVDAVYKSLNINDISNDNNKEYVLKVDNTTKPEPPVTPDPEPTYPDNPGNNNNNNNGNSNNSNDPKEEENLEDENNQETSDEEEDSDSEDKIPVINNEKDKNNNNTNKDNSSVDDSLDVSRHNQKIIKYLWIILGGLTTLAIILAVIYARKTNKLKKMQ